jgi:molybdenum cofactor cytidylyltransferase
VKLVAIVLAAGMGNRFGGNKLAALLHGEPLISHAIRAARAAPVERVIVVCPPNFDPGQWQGAPAVVTAPLESDALSASLKAGIAAAESADGAFVFLGDMPLVPHDLAGKLAELLGDYFAAVPRHDGHNGHPVLLSARAFPAISGLQGDEGAGKLLKARKDVAFLDVSDEAVLVDVDRVEDLARLQGGGEMGA